MNSPRPICLILPDAVARPTVAYYPFSSGGRRESQLRRLKKSATGHLLLESTLLLRFEKA